LGDTIRVSLTEDPEYELQPCKTLISIGSRLINDESLYKDIPAWVETSRNFLEFTKRRGVLPEQQEGDTIDIRGYMHRDGSVVSSVSIEDLQNSEALYRSLGARMVMGLPFKEIDTSDSIYLPKVPHIDDKASRKTIKRLQDVNMGVIAPIEELIANPFPNAVAVVTLESLALNGLPALPEGSIRYAVKCTGLEPATMYTTLQSISMITNKLVLGIIEVPLHASRVHASRRVFQLLHDINSNLPIIHSVVFDQTPSKDELILRVGSEAGALLVDGLGDGAMISAPGFSLDMLRSTSFGLLQGARMRSVKTDFVSCPSCGRTLFDLQEVTEQIKQKTGHLPGVSVAIMGCIVNGPGEMADADFGYVGGAPGRVMVVMMIVGWWW